MGPGGLQDEPRAGKRKDRAGNEGKKAERKALFVAEYLIDMNATRAAIRCGYAANSAAVTASRLMKDPWVKAELRRELTERRKRLKLTAERFDEEVAKLAYSNLYDYGDLGEGVFDLRQMTRDQAAAIAEVKFSTVLVQPEGPADEHGNLPANHLITTVAKLKLHSKTQALLIMGRRLKLLKDEVEHTGKVTVVVDL